MNNILSILEDFSFPNAENIGLEIARDFRQRRVEKNLTRKQLAEMSGVPAGNLARFEQKGLISLSNLISLAAASGYLPEIRNLFAQAKYSTMEELTRIRDNANRKRAYGR